MDYTTQLRIGELLRQLLGEDETHFDPALAKELLALTPKPRVPYIPFSIDLGWTKTGSVTSGLTSTGSSASVDDTEEKNVHIGQKGLWVGKYKIHRDDGWLWPSNKTVLFVQDRFLDTREAEQQDGQWQIRFHRGEPVEILRPELNITRVPFGAGQMVITRIAFYTWKTPEKA